MVDVTVRFLIGSLKPLGRMATHLSRVPVAAVKANAGRCEKIFAGQTKTHDGKAAIFRLRQSHVILLMVVPAIDASSRLLSVQDWRRHISQR